MTDPKKPGHEGAGGASGSDDTDWDQALSEWDNKTFVPEVAKDTSTDKPGVLAGTTSKPLYRPPSPPRSALGSTAPLPRGRDPLPAAGRPPPRPTPSIPAMPRRAPGEEATAAPRAPASPPLPPPLRSPPPLPTLHGGDLDYEEDGATLIAAIPQELLRSEDNAPKSSSRGGLGQLFARDEKRDASVDVSFDESQPRMPTAEARPRPEIAQPVRAETASAPPPRETPSDVFTSAQVVPTRPDRPEAPPVRRSMRAPPEVPDGAMFDPFTEPEPRSAQATRPAESEIDDLLKHPPPSSSSPPQADEARAKDADAAATSEPPTSDPSGGPALLAPDARRYDPNEETMVGRDADIARARQVIAARRASSSGAIQVTRTWPDEKPAAQWLSDEARSEFAHRAAWLEEEARTLTDKPARARALLSCSEIHATLGDREKAQALALEARDTVPSLALAHRQARGLMPSPPDPEDYVEALDAEVKMTPAGPARVHSMLLIVDALRAAGDDEGSAKRLDQAARTVGADVRGFVLRAVQALARNDLASTALRVPDGGPEIAIVGQALGAALRLRGVERKDPAGGDPSPNEVLLRARAALDKGDVGTAVPLLSRLSNVPELAAGATWLAASLAATHEGQRHDSARWLRELADQGDAAARPALVSRAVELGDRDLLAEAVAAPGPLTSAERMTLAALAGVPISPTESHLEAAASTPGMQTLAGALAALATIAAGEDRAAQVLARAGLAAGSAESRALVRLGRLLSSSASAETIENALAALGDTPPPSAKALSLEMAARAGRSMDVSRALQAWGAAHGQPEDRAAGAIAGAMVAERSGEKARALEAFRAARAADPTNEAALRAIASIEQVDLVAEMNALSEELGEGMRGAIARLEAITRGEGALPEPTRAELLERAHKAAPGLPVAAFLAERIARKAGDVEEVLRWIRERRATTADAMEAALDSVREALLVVGNDAALATDRLQEAHRARPADVGLRELYERVSVEPLDDRAAWRERRASESAGDVRTLLFLEAALEHDRAGDREAALRCAEAAAASDASLGRVARERAELAAGNVARLADELFSAAKATDDVHARREAYERLAVLDATARNDPASALLWHRSILEEQPGHLPSLRHLEHHLIGEGRDDELEPIASGIAVALRGADAAEASAHAELAARMRLRGVEGSWDATREMVELAASETPPSLWSLRMLEAHSRARGDDTTFLDATVKLLERSTRPAEAASLLVRAGEAAARLGRLEDARSLLERAAVEDPGDVVAWGLLADVRQRAGDLRGAAEACEALARSSFVREHQLLAWYDAGRIWQDDVQDEERAMVALESAGTIDPAYEEIFDRLSRVYAARKMQPELAALLERRLEGISDPDERLAMEVRRGRVLLDVGDAQGARAAFEAALAQRPDDAGALSAFADLCVVQKDWDAAEQALVRLARLLPTPEEQKDVYARLGDLYSKHLLNLSRAEVALKEVLKRAPDDVTTLEKLVDVYRRQNDPARAIETQQELIAKATSPDEKRARVTVLAAIHEHTAHDNRKAEQTLEAARRESPQDVGILRALADFYIRHQQTPAVNILLDRAGADARRGLAAGRFSNALFEILATVFELRGKRDAAHVTQAMLAALEGRPSDLRGAAERAFDPRLDDLLAPDVLSPAMRTLLAKTGDALDAAVPYDARGQKAVPLAPDSPIARIVATAAHATGIGPVQVLVSPRLGATCIPAGSSPPTLVVGEGLAQHERLAGFLVLRALKLVQAHASALARTPAAELPVLISAWLKCFNPSWQPQGVNAAAVNAMGGKVQAGLPRQLGPDVGVVALEVAGTLGTQAATLGNNALYWGNRVTLLSLGDPTSMLDAIAVAGGLANGAPREPKERTTWIGRAAEARDLISFGVTDAFSEARARVMLDR